MNLKKNAITWAVVLAVLLVLVGGLYVFTHLKGKEGTDTKVPGSYTFLEVAAANTVDRCWAVIGDSVYDMTAYAKEDARILSLCGTDASAGVSAMGEGAEKNFANLRIGSLQR